MSRQTIRHEGDSAESKFLSLVSSSRRSSDSRRGDAEIRVDGSWHFVEIKECHSNTINQVRAIKYTPLVIYAPRSDPPWIVLPPHELVGMVSRRARGQHNEIPFECANLSLSSIDPRFRSAAAELQQRVASAIRQSSANPDLKQEMEILQEQVADLNASSKARVREVIRKAMSKRHL